MIMRLLHTSALAILFAASACGPANEGLESVHQPIVQRADYEYDLRPADFMEAGSPSLARIDDWFDQASLRFGDRLSFDPATAPYVSEMIAQVASDRGIGIVRQPGIGAGAPPGTIRLVVSRTRATVSGCPDWSSETSTLSNYGCAVNGNLATMVADPNDLIRGRAAQGADPADAVKSVGAWRNRVLTGWTEVAGDPSASGSGKKK
jgi:pilus assembly protein CpaD